jgi:hypothetical protein
MLSHLSSGLCTATKYRNIATAPRAEGHCPFACAQAVEILLLSRRLFFLKHARAPGHLILKCVKEREYRKKVYLSCGREPGLAQGKQVPDTRFSSGLSHLIARVFVQPRDGSRI